MSQRQLEDIDLLFAEIIESNGLLTMDITRNYMSESLELMPLVEDANMVKKVYDRVAYLKGKDLPSKLAQIEKQAPEQRAREWISKQTSSSLQSGARSKWHKDDEDRIAAAFGVFKVCPGKQIIEDIFKSDASLAEIHQRKGLSRCYEKVKNLFKKWKKQ